MCDGANAVPHDTKCPPLVVKDVMQKLYYLRCDGKHADRGMRDAVQEATGVEAGEQRLVWRGTEVDVHGGMKLADLLAMSGQRRRHETMLLLRRTHYTSPIPTEPGSAATSYLEPRSNIVSDAPSTRQEPSSPFSAVSTMSYLKSFLGTSPSNDADTSDHPVSATPPNSVAPSKGGADKALARALLVQARESDVQAQRYEVLQRKYNALVLENETNAADLGSARRRADSATQALRRKEEDFQKRVEDLKAEHVAALAASRRHAFDVERDAERARRDLEDRTEQRLRDAREAAAQAVQAAEMRIRELEHSSVARRMAGTPDAREVALKADAARLEGECETLRQRLAEYESYGAGEVKRAADNAAFAASTEPSADVTERHRMQRRIAFLERELDSVSRKAHNSQQESHHLQKRNGTLVDSFQSQRRLLNTILDPMHDIEEPTR